MYDFLKVEEKWQRLYSERRLFEVDLQNAQKPFYNLMMFPYPSASGLHIGNMYSFIGSDVYGRFMRLKGHDVFEPIGFDAFGIHSENYALRVDRHPAELTPESIEYFREKQLKRIGAIYDWRSEVITSSPEYYKWTQWIFVKLFKAGLANKKLSRVNWCPNCKTVLADEQVIDGRCERCDSQATRKETSQWFFEITRYAERLLKNLEKLDWTETTKSIQRSWIGKSSGAVIRFPLENGGPELEAFTTRPDTVYGVTYLVVAPEVEHAPALVIAEKKDEFKHFMQDVEKMDIATRTSIKREKRGMFTGSYAKHPLTGEKLQIWVADYVLAEYGTGAVMAVPAHDERDFDFALKYELPIKQTIACESAELPFTGYGKMINSGKHTGKRSEDFIADVDKIHRSMSSSVTYHLHDWCVSRQRYWGPPIPIVYCDKCGTVPVPEEQLPVLLPETDDYVPDGSGKSPLARNEEFVHTECPECSGPAKRETDVNDNFLDSAWYFLRYVSPDNEASPFDDDLAKKWLPVDMYIGGNEHANLHLMYARFITMALHDTGYLHFEEPFKSFRGHGLIVNEGQKMSKSKDNMINPIRYFETHGVDCLRTYLMFMGSFLEGGDFRDSGMDAVKRFLNRVWEIANHPEGESSDSLKSKMAWAIDKVEYSVRNIKYNTGVAALMEFVNEALKEENIEKKLVLDLARLLSPFAPFIAEEIHALKGETVTILDSGFPSGYEEYAKAVSVEIPVQINGKIRGKVSAERGIDQERLMELVSADEKLSGYLKDVRIRKVVFVKDKILNIVVS